MVVAAGDMDILEFRQGPTVKVPIIRGKDRRSNILWEMSFERTDSIMKTKLLRAYSLRKSPHLSTRLCVCLSICLCICLSVFARVCASAYLSVCLCIRHPFSCPYVSIVYCFTAAFLFVWYYWSSVCLSVY